MIVELTRSNFTCLDLQIEAAYRRNRCAAARRKSCKCRFEMEAVAQAADAGAPKASLDCGRAWLRKLAAEMEALTPTRKLRRRKPKMGRLIAANSKLRGGGGP